MCGLLLMMRMVGVNVNGMVCIVEGVYKKMDFEGLVLFVCDIVLFKFFWFRCCISFCL